MKNFLIFYTISLVIWLLIWIFQGKNIRNNLIKDFIQTNSFVNYDFALIILILGSLAPFYNIILLIQLRYRITYTWIKRIGILFRPSSFWIGIHYSKYNKRLCINILPCLTIWIGNKPINL